MHQEVSTGAEWLREMANPTPMQSQAGSIRMAPSGMSESSRGGMMY
jgi:hypothetical protein